jgi:ATP synthase proteolipid subunit
MSSVFSGDETAPFFGFLGAAAALVFSCTPTLLHPPHTAIDRRLVDASFARSVAARSRCQIPAPIRPIWDAPTRDPVRATSDRFFFCVAGMGAAYGTAKSGVGVASMGVMRPELVMKSIVPVVMAGVLGIYGLIIAVIISTGINPKAKPYFLFDGYAHLSSGLACGLAGLAAGMAIGIVGDAGVR